jgi:integrase
MTREPVFHRGRRVPNLYKRTLKDGSEVYEYRGKLRRTCKTIQLEARNPSDAVAEVERLRSDVRDGKRKVEPSSRMIVREAGALWLEDLKHRPRPTERTQAGYDADLRNHIYPALGDERLSEVDDRAIRNWSRGLDPSLMAGSHGQIVSVCSRLFAFALSEGFIETNPVNRARERWHDDLRRKDEQPYKARAYSDDELELLFSAIKSPEQRGVLRFCLETGARISEAIGVRFCDVDLAERLWTVAGQMERSFQWTPRLKNETSRAVLPLWPAAVEIIKSRRELLMERDGFAAAQSEAFVFAQASGLPPSYSAVYQSLRRANKKLFGEDTGRTHRMRLSFCSRLAERTPEREPVELPVAQKFMRHANLSETSDTYTKVRGNDEGMLRRMRKAIGDDQ